MASPILDRYREIAPSTKNFSDEALAEELRENFYPDANPETFKANVGVTRDITKRPIDRYRAQTPQTWGMGDQELVTELHSRFGKGETVERYAEQLGVEFSAPSRRRPESSAIDSGIGVGRDSAETDSDQLNIGAQDPDLALPSANFSPSPDADLSGGAARRARREARPDPIAEQDEGPSAFAIANEGARQGVAGLYESFYATPRTFRRTVIDPVNEIADRAIESLGGDPKIINPRVNIDTGAVGKFFNENEKAFREWADKGGNREAAQALAEKAEKANQAFDNAKKGDFSGIAQVVSDPSSWAGFIGQAAPSLALAALSGGSIAVIAWMESLEAAKDAEDFERRTGVKLSPMEFTRAVGQTAAVNSILEKAGVDRVLNPGSGSLVTRALKAGTAEGTTEALQEISSNVAAQTYDPERSTTENVLPGAMGGFGSGALVGSSQTPAPNARRDDEPPEDISIPDPETGGGPLTQPSITNQQDGRDFGNEFAAIDQELNRLQSEVIAPSRNPNTPSPAPEVVAEAEQRVSALLDQRDRLTDELRQIEQEQRPQLEAPQQSAPGQASQLPDLQVAIAENQRRIEQRREQIRREGVPGDQAASDPTLQQLERENQRAAQTLSSLQERADEQQANAAIDRNRAPTDDALGGQIEQTRDESRQGMREEIQRLRQMTTRPAPLTSAVPEQPRTPLQTQAQQLRERARVQQPATPIAPDAQPSRPVNNPATGEFTPERVATENIEIDPETYQFRENVNRDGVDDRLEGITQFDDLRAGTVIVHQRNDGRAFVADGHHRVDLARRLGRDNINAIVLRESDGFSAADARRFAAERNIAEENATALDAAKVFREYGGDPATVAEQRDLPRRSQVVRDGANIAQLSDEAFGAVLNEQITEKDAAAIGRNFSDPDQQLAAVQQYQRVRPSNDRQREILANEIREAGFSQGEQGGLFGSDPAESLIAERVQVQDAAIRRLSRSGSLFRTLNENAATAERAGNQIARDQNAAIQQNAALAADLMRRASTTPEINQAINEAAQRVKDGESIRRVAADLEERIINEAQRLGSASPGTPPDIGLGSADQTGQDAGRGQSVPSPDAGRDGESGEQRLPGAESELLTQPTPESLRARDQAQADAQAAQADADRRADAASNVSPQAPAQPNRIVEPPARTLEQTMTKALQADEQAAGEIIVNAQQEGLSNDDLQRRLENDVITNAATGRRDGLSEGTNQATTGAPIKTVGYRVDGIAADDLYTGAQAPILGAGEYTAPTAADAKSLAPDPARVEAREVEVDLNRPLVIESDADWRAITQEAGWESPNPTNLSTAQANRQTANLQQLLRGRGYDGVVVRFDSTSIGDANQQGKSIKTLRQVFSVPQAVRFAGGSDTEADQAAARGQDTLLEGSRPEYGVVDGESSGQDARRVVEESSGERESQGELFTLSGEPNAVKRAPDSAFNVDGATEVLAAPSGRFGTVTSTKRTVTYSLPDTPIRTAADAATATAQVRKNAQENLLALVTDANGQVVDLIRHSVGDLNRASANASILAGSVLRVPGASNVWISHNHPAGKSSLSSADRGAFKAIRNLMNGSGVEARAIIAVGDSKYSADLANGESVVEARLRPARRTRKIAVSERTLNRRGKLADKITNPDSAINVVKDLGGNTSGVALLNNQFQPVAWIPVSIDEMGAMRNTGVLERVLRSVERGNANSAILSVGDSNLKDLDIQRAVANISRFFSDANVRLLDSVSTNPEMATSKDPILNDDIETSMPTAFFNRSESEASGLSASEAMGYVDGLMSGWQNAPEVLVAQGEADLPEFLQQRIQKAGAQGEVRGVIWDSRIYVIADNVSSRAEVEETIFHEVVRHYGMRQVLGENYNDFMDQVYMRVGRSAIEPFAEYNGLDLDAENQTTRAKNRRAATEELLAHATDEQLGSRLWTRLVNLVTEWLRRMGFAIQMTGYEIRDVLQRAKMYVQDGEIVSGTSVVNKHEVYYGANHSQENGDPAFSRRTNDPDLEEAKQRAGLGGRRRPLGEWIQNLQAVSYAKARDFAREVGHAVAQGAFDRFHGIKRIEQNTVGNIPAEQSAYVAARLSTGIATTMRAILHHGTPQWRDGVLSKIEGSKGLLEILEPVRGDIDTFLGWMVARRAERLYAEGRENLFEPRHIEALRRAGEASPQFEQFKAVAAELDGFKKAVLDVAEQAGLIDPDARAAWDQADYIPFYRIADDTPSASGPNRRQSLSGQSSGIRTLRGGVERLNDPLENLIMNFTHLMDASMKNHAILQLRDNVNGFQGILEEVGPDFKPEMIPMDQVRAQIIRSGGDPSVIPEEAMQGLAKMWAMKPPADDDVIRVMDKGKARYYRVLDPMLLKSLTAIRDSGLQGLPLDFMRWTKRLLTRGVTADPAFMIRNYIRDMMHAWTISEDKFRLGIDSVRGASKTIRETGGTIDMMFAGGSFLGGYVNATDPREVARATRQALRQKGYTAASANQFLSTMIDTPLKAWELFTRFGDSIENASREAVYEAAMRQGRSRAEAVFMAKDLMDYSMRGSYPAVQFLTDVVPFLNARLQGLYKLGRAGVNNPGPIFAKGSVIMLATLALLYDNKDDERYEQLEDWDKDTYWHFFPPEGIPDMPAHIRIPKPFEIGVLFGTIPERISMNALDKEGADKTFERMLWSLNSTFAFNPVPQAIFPPMEVFANRNIFTGAPIENLSDQNRLPEARYSPYTSETMQALGQVTGPVAGLSPKELQHLWRGYTGTLGMYALDAADMISRRLQDKPPKPAMRVDRMPVVKSFIRAEPASRTQFQTDFYDLFNEARQIQGTVDAYVEEGNVEKAMRLAEQNPRKLAALPSMRDTTRDLGKIRGEITMIYQSEQMTPEEKREAIDELISVRNDITRSQVKALQDFFKEDPLKEEQE